MKKKLLLVSGLCMLAACINSQQQPPVPTPFGFMDGSILCCTVAAESYYYVDLQCGKFKIERVHSFVRLPGECVQKKPALSGGDTIKEEIL